MKTINQIKDEYAISRGFQNFRHMDQNSVINERHIDDLIKLVLLNHPTLKEK